MTKDEKQQQETDWELADDFYQVTEGKKKWTLDDFLQEEEPPALEENSEASLSEQVKQMAAQVRQVKELSVQGKTAAQIAEILGVETRLVTDILICVQSFPEDNDIAVAHLILMG